MNYYAKFVYPKKLTSLEKRYIQDYTENYYKYINQDLRDGHVTIYEDRIKNIDNALLKYDNKETLLVYRELNIYGDDLKAYINKLSKGTILEKGYLSTSYKNTQVFDRRNIKMNIIIPPSFIGANIKYISKAKHENEYLIGRDTLLEIINIEVVQDIICDKVYVKARVKDNLHL